MTDTLKIAFIRGLRHADIVDQTLASFQADMQAADRPAEIESFDVPGAFEMPLLARKLAGLGPYEAVVAAALVVDGGIYRHDFVAAAVVNGLMQAQMDTGVPVFSVSSTPHNYQPTEEHHGFFHQHFLGKGAEAAQAVRQIASLEV